MLFAKSNSSIAYFLTMLLLLVSFALPAYATGLDREEGFAQTMFGPSTKPISERLVRDPSGNDTFYQDCLIRIGGIAVGRSTSAITDINGNHNINGLYRTFVHDAGKLGKFKVVLKVRPDVGEVGFAPPVRVLEEAITQGSLKAYPEIANIVLDTNGNVIPGYKMQTVNTDLIAGVTDPTLLTKFNGNGIYNKVKRLNVRCTYLIAPNGDVVMCVHCFFFFGK